MFNPVSLVRNILKKKDTNYLWGLLLVAISFLVWLIPKEQHSLLILATSFSIFGLGCIMFFDGLDYKLSGSSLLINDKDSKLSKTFSLAAVLTGIIFEFLVRIVTKNFIYPYFTPTIYLILFVPGFILYFLIIAESYYACKSILDKYFKKPRIRKTSPELIKWLHIIFLILGIVGILYAFYHYYNAHLKIGGFSHSVNTEIKLETNIFITMMLGTCIWIVMDCIGFFLKKEMLLNLLFRGYLSPFLAVLLACILLGIPMEVWNIPLNLWTYTNIPYADIQLFKIPLFVFLSWPFHYLPLLSMYVLTNKKVGKHPYTATE